MELLSYLRARAAWVAAALAVALLAAAATAAVLLTRSTASYLGQLDVRVPGDAASSSGAASLFIADFTQALSTRDVLDDVREALPGDTEPPELVIERLGQSTTMRLTAEGEDPDVLRTTLRTAALEARREVVGGPSNRREIAVEVLQTEVDAAQSQVDQLRAQSGSLFPDQEFNDLERQIRDIRIEVAQADSIGANLTVARLERDLQPISARRDALAPVVVPYQQAASDLRDADGALADARRDLLISEAVSGTVQEPDYRPVVTEQSPVRDAVTTALLAFVVTLGLCVALLAVSDLLSGGRSRRTAQERTTAPGDEPARDDGVAPARDDELVAAPAGRAARPGGVTTTPSAADGDGGGPRSLADPGDDVRSSSTTVPPGSSSRVDPADRVTSDEVGTRR